MQISGRKRKKRKRNRGGRRNAYFCIGLSQLWREKIHSVIKRPQKSHGLTFLRVRMYYPRFHNLGEILQGDMVGKFRKGIRSKYFLNRECNCNSTTKVKVTCAYKGECRTCCLFYKVIYRLCLSVYVGNTQNNLKKIMKRHFQDVAQKVHHDKNSDTFGAHFAQHFDQKPTPQQFREIMKFEILFKVNPIRSMKTCSKYSCTLCMKEIL